ncbi:MAG: LamG-like jellyroll fold domain-containing protein [Chitinophagaceae bacterium]
MRTITLLFAWLSLSASAFSQNLVAYYPFNGNANDQSGNAINPTYVGSGVTLTTDRLGNPNKAYNFDGATGSYLRMPSDLLPTTNRTISLWFNVPDVTNMPGLLGYGGNGSYGTTLLMGLNCTGTGQYWVQGHGGLNGIGYTYPTAPVNNWYHWVLTINGSTQKIYVNGELKSTANTFSGSTAVAGRDFALGVITDASGVAPYTDVNVGYLNGKLDDIRIYDNAMTDAQVQDLFTSESMAAYYPFNGNAIDETGNGNNSSYIGSGVTLTSDRYGNANKAYYFDGAVGSYIRVPADKFPTTDRTISFWFNADQLGYYVPTPFSYGGNGCNNSLLMIINHYDHPNSYLVTSHCASNVITAPYTVQPVNNWYHLTLTISGSTQKIFVNGVLKQSTNSFTSSTYVTGTSALLGACLNTDGITPWAGYFRGKLDEFRIYNNAMTDAQAQQLYKVESTGLVAYFPFNGNANDESGNGNHGTPVNSPTYSNDRFNVAGSSIQMSATPVRYVSVLNSPSIQISNQLSISAWVKRNSLNTIDEILNKGGDVNSGTCNYGLVFTPGELIFKYNGGYHLIHAPQDLNWHHYAITTYNGSPDVKFYIDGVYTPTWMPQGNINLNGASTADLNIGAMPAAYYSNNIIDELRIYNRILSPNEILQLADVPILPDLLAYLPMNGNANDMSGNGHNGVVTGTVLATTDKYNSNNAAYEFQGFNSNITLANSWGFNFNTSGFTLSSWIKYKSIDGLIISKHNCWTPNGYILSVNNNQLSLQLANGVNWTSVTTAESFINDKWYFVTAVYDGIGQAYIYVDGVMKAGNAVVYNNINTAPVIISGADNGCPQVNYRGSIDEVKIYGSPLSAAQVMALYKQSRGSGNAFNFDGVDDYIVTNQYMVPTTGNFTVELWVYNRNINGFREFISQGWGPNAFYIGTSNLTGNIRLGDTWGTTVVLPQNKWVHLAVVKSGSNGVLYMDGIQVATSTAYSIGAGGTQTQIGKQYGPHLEYADAFMDEIRIWNTALSTVDVRDWMNRKITPDHPVFSNLVSYYNFDEKNVLRTYETKGAKTGMLVNGPQYVTSGAPIGDASVHNIATPLVSATLTLPTGENFSALQGAGTALGLYVYVVKDPPEIQTGILGLGSNDHYFGVKKAEDYSGGITASYTATYNYTGNPFVSSATEPTLQLFKRNDNSAATWTHSGATLNTTANTLIVTGQNTEYILGSSGFGLPVTLLSFQAQKINATTAKLTWQTATELNNKGFEIQRSFDGIYFSNVGFVNGSGNSDVLKEYSTMDMPGKTGRVYYRLKQIDLDGNSKLSNIVSIFFDKQNIIKVYPKPAQQQLTVEGIESYSKLQLLDAAGKLLKEVYINGAYQININLNGFKSGIYLLRMINEKESQTVKLIIHN